MRLANFAKECTEKKLSEVLVSYSIDPNAWTPYHYFFLQNHDIQQAFRALHGKNFSQVEKLWDFSCK